MQKGCPYRRKDREIGVCFTMVNLSKRLLAVAGLAGSCKTAADVGTDHGYIPVHLVLAQKAERAIAMDVNKGPLRRAEEHILQYGLEHQIETRLSDGLAALEPGEADVIVVAGMGGALMQRILAQGQETARKAVRLVLQPQSEVMAFRQFLFAGGYQITAEDMVLEDGKYYPVIAAQYAGSGKNAASFCFAQENQYQEHAAGQTHRVACKFGPVLLRQSHPVLKQFLLRQQQQKQKILEQLQANARQDITGRRQELLEELEDIRAAFRLMDETEQERRKSYGLP